MRKCYNDSHLERWSLTRSSVVSCVLASLTLGVSLILLWHQYGLDGQLVLPMATLSGLLSQPIEAAEAIHDLLDTEMLVRTPGRSLVNQKAVHFGEPFSCLGSCGQSDL